MITQAELISRNNPTTEKKYQFFLNGIKLKYAPDGWEDDEYMMARDMKLFGVFRKFVSSELKFVKEYRDYLRGIYEQGGVNAVCTFSVNELLTTGVSRNRFIGYIDFSTYKITELSVDVAVIDGSFTDLVLTRSKVEVNILSTESIDGATVDIIPIKSIIIPAVTIFKYAYFGKRIVTFNSSHVIPLLLNYSVFTEAVTPTNVTDTDGGAFFMNAISDYTNTSMSLQISIVADDMVWAHFKIQLLRFHSGVMTEVIYEHDYQGTGIPVPSFDLVDVINFNIILGDYFVLQLIQVSSAPITYVYSKAVVALNHTSVAQESKTIYGVTYFDALRGLVQQYTGITNRVSSNFLSKYPEIPDNLQQGVLTQNRWLITTSDPIRSLVLSLDKLEKALTVYNLGVGIETRGSLDMFIVEPMDYFYNNQIILDISDRFDGTTIEKQVMPELFANRIEAGFESSDLDTSAGIFEPNAKSTWSTNIRPIDNILSIISPIRSDTTGILAAMNNPDPDQDPKSQGDLFMLDTVRVEKLSVWNIHARTTEGFDLIGGGTGLFMLYNLDLSPARILYRNGRYISAFLQKYLSSLIKFQKSEKGSDLFTHKTSDPIGLVIRESADISPATLLSPLWHPESFGIEVPIKESDIDYINANPYGIIKITSSEYGWILNYKSNNENHKSNFKLLRVNTAYVTPGNVPLVPPITSLTITKTVSGNPGDTTSFYITIVKDFKNWRHLILTQQAPIVILQPGYGNYSIIEAPTAGYNLTSVYPADFAIGASNPNQVVSIYNNTDNGVLTITSIITGYPADNTFFHVTITGQRAIDPAIYDGWVSQSEPLVISGMPLDSYLVTQDATVGYPIVSITPWPVILTAGSLTGSVVVVNEVAAALALELTFNSILNVPVANVGSVSDWNVFFNLPTNGTPFASVEVVVNTIKLYGGKNIKLKDNLFYAGEWEPAIGIVKVFDYPGCIIEVGYMSFAYATYLTDYSLPKITKLGFYAFSGSTITTANFPLVTEISYGCFVGCTNLINIYFPLLTYIEHSVFYGTALTYVNHTQFPMVTELRGGQQFSFCANLLTVDLSEVTIITPGAYGTFASCFALTSVNINGLSVIGSGMFHSCTGFVNFNFPNATTIGAQAFYDCVSAQSFYLPSLSTLPFVGAAEKFYNIIGNNITLTVKATLMTSNGGNPPPDIQYLLNNNTVTIITV